MAPARMFRTVTKQTLGGYIRERRLTLAAEALRQTQRPVFDIAMQYGYDSQQTFSRVFRRQFSQTPTAYRHSMRRQALVQRPRLVNFDCSEGMNSLPSAPPASAARYAEVSARARFLHHLPPALSLPAIPV